jgi:hypothetical protein
MPSLEEVCDGNAGSCWLNVLLSPFVLVYNAFRNYIFACFEVLYGRAFRFCCRPFVSMCSEWVFTDTTFEGDAAIGIAGKSLDWVRVNELFSKEDAEKGLKPKLYEGGIEPSDLCQGAVGDCWLVAALACAAEHPSSIRNAFVTPEYNSRGRYVVRLFDPEKEAWESITVDDRIPCAKGTKRPEFMKCDGKELWAVLLEKAFAKFCGSCACEGPPLSTRFASSPPRLSRPACHARAPRLVFPPPALAPTGTAPRFAGLTDVVSRPPPHHLCLSRPADNRLDGGWAVWGWRALTGDHVFRMKLDEKAMEADGTIKWGRFNVDCKKNEKDGTAMYLSKTKEEYGKEQMWNLILNYVDDKSLVAASGGKEMGKSSKSGKGNNDGLNGEQLNDSAGLVGTHAYSILDARELGLIPGLSLGAGVLGQTRLIRLRNPWGKYEWKGAWSDGSQEWKDNPLVRMRLRPKDEDDGSFWMPWDEFVGAGFTKIDICDRTTKSDLRLNVNEDYGFLGIILGCCTGLVKFWCFCQGCLTVYFGSTSSKKTKSTKRGCAKCMEKDDVVEPVPVQIDRA